MSKGRLGTWLMVFALTIAVPPVSAQWYTPQSDKLLKLTWSTERIGPSRVLILGEVQNLSEHPASRVILRAEGLDENGRVVSRARGSVQGEIPSRKSSSFEIRLIPSGSERKYRVTVESFEFLEPGREPLQAG